MYWIRPPADWKSQPNSVLTQFLIQLQEHPPRTAWQDHMFLCCQEAVARQVFTKKYSSMDWDERESFALHCSEEFYFLLCNRGKDRIIQYPLSYLTVAMRGWFEEWYKLECKNSMNTEHIAHIKCNPDRTARYVAFDMETITDKDRTAELLESLINDLNKTLRYTKLIPNPVDRINSRITMSLSIKYGKFTPFRLDSRVESLCRYLYNKFRIEFQKICSETHQNILSDKQYLEYIGCEIRGDWDEEEL